MNSRPDVVKNLQFRVFECAVIILTTLVLVSVLGFLATTLFSFGSAQAPATGAPESQRLARQNPRQDKAGTNSSAKINAAPTPKKDAENAHPAAREAAPKQLAQQPGLVPAPSVIGQTILTAAVIFALALIAAVVFAFCFFAWLRRHSREFGPLIRIEYAGAQPTVIGPFTASSLGVVVPTPVPAAPDGNNQRGTMSAETVAAHTATAADFGGSFDAERHLQDAKAKRFHAAVLHQLLEDNLTLQADIGLAQARQESSTLEKVAK